MDTNLKPEEWPFTPDLKKFAEFLGLPAKKDARGVNWDFDNRIERKLKALYEYGKSRAGSDDIVDIMYEIRQIQRRIGGEWSTIESLNKLYGWVALDSDYQKLRSEAEKIASETEKIEKEKSLLEEVK